MKYKPLSEIIDLGTLYESHAKEQILATFYIALYQINYKVGVEMS